MRRFTLMVLGLLLILLLLPLAGYAQEPEQQPLVVFLEDRGLATASIQNRGPDGISELEQIFKNLGARTAWANLNGPLPEEARVLVIVRPQKPLPAATVARLWTHLLRGNHLLLTMDPIGPTTYRAEGGIKSNSDRAKAGFPTLLWLVYGIGLQDTLVAEPWFTTASVGENRTAHVTAHIEDFARHPVTAPLSAYDLPVQLWGARSMWVEPMGPHSYAVPLLYSQTAFGESNADVFKSQAPVEINLGPDPIGRLLLGALAENTLTGSRVVVLGDSESVENGYGLAKWPGTGRPIHVANRILTERLAAWLLDRPVEEWPSLPTDFTWLSIDGRKTDWIDGTEIMQDDLNDALIPGYDIQSLHAFRDDRFFYALIELTGPPNPNTRVTLNFVRAIDGARDLSVILSRDAIRAVQADKEVETLTDGSMAIDTAIEIRLPLRVISDGVLIGNACVSNRQTLLTSLPIDCAMLLSATIPVAATASPVDTWDTGVHAIVNTLEDWANVRARPATSARIIATAYYGQVFAATGRTVLGDWIQVQNAVYTGWMASSLVNVNIDLQDLPIVEP